MAIVRGVLRHSRIDKVLFNGATFSLFGLLATMVASMAGGVSTDSPPFQGIAGLALATFAASGVYYLHTFVIAAAVALDVHARLTRVWARNFRWLFPHYVVLGFLGLGVAIATIQLGPIGTALFMAPLVAMRFVLKQYTDRTTGAVERLEAANADLLATSSLLRHRGDQLALLSDLGDLAAREAHSASLPLRVAERCVPPLGNACAVLWQGLHGMQCVATAVEGFQPLAATLRMHSPDMVAALAAWRGQQHSTSRMDHRMEWHVVRPTASRAGCPTRLDPHLDPDLLTNGDLRDRTAFLHVVAGRLALVLERDALLEEAAAVDALRAVDRAKSDFVAITAHELRTPLTSVQGYAELLRNEVNRFARSLAEHSTGGNGPARRRPRSAPRCLPTGLGSIPRGSATLRCR